MHRRSLSLVVLMLALALPLSASQFMEVSFDTMARQSALIVRGEVLDTWSAWDDAHEVIFTYATVRVHRYFGEATGPDTLIVREVGGTVDGYTQEAIGFPAIRAGEDTVLFLSTWEDSADYRIHAYNQGKFLVRNRGGIETLVRDPERQGEARMARSAGGIRSNAVELEEAGLGIEELAQMVNDARAGHTVDIDKRK